MGEMTREQALNYLRSSGFSEEQINAVVDALLEPKQEWISVEDRLPEEGQIVLITQTYGWKEFEEGTEVTIAQYHRKHFTWYRYQKDWDKHTSIMTHGDICPGNEYVTAWMPLPEPYKADKE